MIVLVCFYFCHFEVSLVLDLLKFLLRDALKVFHKTCLLVGSFESKLLVDVFGVVLSLLNQLFDSLVHLFNLASNFSLFLSEIPLYRLLFLVLASKCCLKDSLNACPVHFDLVL